MGKSHSGETCFLPGGKPGALFEANIEGWLLRMEEENPALFSYFLAREEGRRPLVAWYGEFPGKFLTAVAECYAMTGDRRLLPVGGRIAEMLRKVQDADGYLGPYRRDQRMVGFTLDHPNEWPLWDIWGHYHCIYGLCLWHEAVGDPHDLQTARRAADYVIGYFAQPGRRYVDAGAPDQNLAIAHGYLKLYTRTGEEKYRAEADRIIDTEWKDESVGDWRGAALSGQEFYQMHKPRWESLHSILAMGERSRLTGNAEDRLAFTRIWESIRRTDRHNDGGFSSGEGACGNPYDPRAVETCCTVLWMVYTTEYLRLTRDCRAADELELSLWNAYAGSILNHGRDFTYDTPMDGRRMPSSFVLAWQTPAGGTNLNCCQMNGTRGFGQWGRWALLSNKEGLYCNYYGACAAEIPLPNGTQVKMRQITRYPLEGQIEIQLSLTKPEHFALFLRNPSWSADTKIQVNGAEIPPSVPGSYTRIERLWQDGDRIRLELDLTPHFWEGQRECAGKVSVYCGPILLTADSMLSGDPWIADRTFSRESLRSLRLYESGETSAWFCADALLEDGTPVRLVDFASAGSQGQEYASWLRVPETTETKE